MWNLPHKTFCLAWSATVRYFPLFRIKITYTLNVTKESRRDKTSKRNLINHLLKNYQNHTSTSPLSENIRQTEKCRYFNISISCCCTHLPFQTYGIYPRKSSSDLVTLELTSVYRNINCHLFSRIYPDFVDWLGFSWVQLMIINGKE